MHRFRVSSQVDLLLECLVTEITCEWFNAGMLAHMGDQIAALAEGLATDATLVRLFT